MKRQVDTLIMSATPIPRTLSLSMYGDIDISIIYEKPKNRKEIITTAVHKKKVELLIERIKERIKVGEKVYWICPLIDESEKLDSVVSVTRRYEILKEYFKENVVNILHGTLKEKEKNEILEDFANPDGNTKILVSTTVIEVGIDIPDATIIIIENPERFGLSQIHQLRGRVGRGDKQSYCILLYENNTQNSLRRLNILKSNNDGFKIAEEDLKLRGRGDILGTRQSGTIEKIFADLNYHYHLLSKVNEMAKTITNYENLLKIFLYENLDDNKLN
jgi:ATP-dependent DNA helicase RecG